MTLVVETGTGGNPLANCYISAASADTYFADRGITAWTGSTAAKEAAILRAVDYLEWAYAWKAQRLTDDQPLQWPRSFYPIDTWNRSVNLNVVPPVIAKANAELALRALTGDLTPDTSGPKVQSESSSIGGAVSKSKTYATGGWSNQRRFPMVDNMLSRYASGGSTGVRAARVERA